MQKKLTRFSPRYLKLIPALLAGLALAGCGPSAAEKKAQAEKAEKARVAAVAKANQEAAEEKAKAKAAEEAAAVTPAKFEGLASARVESGYISVLYANGRKGVLPIRTLSEAEVTWLTAFATAHPLAHGASTVVVAKTETKKTIEKQVTENGVETVQLCAPSKVRDQIGGTCMFYGRVHYLDIAGYPVEDVEIYRVINNVPRDQPYMDYHYYVGMLELFLKQKPSPILHYPDNTLTPFEWARQELRKGRPILAGLPEDIWMSLPADFVATHPFDGSGKIGHQVVINGFTYDPATQKGTFHVVNSWRQLPEFDVPVEKADERRILMEQSISPRGEPPEQAVKVVAGKITVLKAVGTQSLYAVDTNLGPRRVVAASEEAAKALVEADTSAKDIDTIFGEMVIKIFDYIQENANPRVRDAAGAVLLSEVLKVPEGVTLPHVDLEVKSSLGTVYFVRVERLRVVKLLADSNADAIEKAKRMPPAKS